MTTTHEVVAALGRAIAQRIGEARYGLWFGDNTRLSWDGAQLTVGVPNRFYQEWLQNTFAASVQEAARSVVGSHAAVQFIIDPELFQARRTAEKSTLPAAPPAETSPRPAHRLATRRWLLLDDFVVGPCNRLAHSAAAGLVKHPALSANPLTLHAPTGVGKTHLLEGIYVGLRDKLDDCQPLYVTAEEYTNRFLHAMRNGKLDSFRKQFREAGALLVDDLHFLANKAATQEEFLHTFEALKKRGRPIAVTCDCHPKLVPELMPELADRLLGGGVWAIEPPHAETRRAILRHKASRLGCPLPPDAVRYLAEHVPGHVRELEGALHAVHHHSLTQHAPLTLELARLATVDLIRHATRVIELKEVERALCQVAGIDRKALRAKTRVRTISHLRMLGMHLARKHTGAAFSEIGRYFGGRNHSTAIAAEKRVQEWLRDDESLFVGERRWSARELVACIERELLR